MPLTEIFLLFFNVGLITLLAVMSPGPDFVVVSQAGTRGLRRQVVMVALGVATGTLVHGSLAVFGLGVVIKSLPTFLEVIRWAGGFYLIYLGIQTLRAIRVKPSGSPITSTVTSDQTLWQAWSRGFFTNLLNPKATLFFIGLFSQAPLEKMVFGMKLGLTLEITAISLTWFLLVAWMMSHQRFLQYFAKAQENIERAFGCGLMAMGFFIALA